MLIGDGSPQTIILGPDDDILHGGDGDDLIGSAGGDDQVFGDEGNDTVFGGIGADTLSGGADSDIFRFMSYLESNLQTTDVIEDFQQNDRIQLTDIAGINLDPVTYNYTTSISATITAIKNDTSVTNQAVFFTDATDGYLYINGTGALGRGVYYDSTLIKLNGVKTAPEADQITDGLNARLFMGLNQQVELNSSGVDVFGNYGNEEITISEGVYDISLNQSVEHINLKGTSNSYSFKQTGNILNMYDAAGVLLIAKISVQTDTDGTLLSFSNGAASLQIQSLASMTLGGATISTTTPTVLEPALSVTSAVVNTTTVNNKVFLTNNASFTANSSNLDIFTNAGSETITIGPNASNTTVYQHADRIVFTDQLSNYSFQQTGNVVNIYNADGQTLLLKTAIQGTSDIAELVFADTTASVTIKTGLTMWLDDVQISNTTPTVYNILGISAQTFDM